MLCSCRILLCTSIVTDILPTPLSSRNATDANSSSTYFKIPKILHQSWFHKNISAFTKITKQQFQKNKERNPDIEFILWDDRDVEVFLLNEFPREVYDAYMNINPNLGAAKGDLFRYAVLFKRGGLWLDLESSLHTPNFFGVIIQPNDKVC